MNQEKEMNQNSNSALEYLSPSVKVLEVTVCREMCQQSPVDVGFSSMEDEEGEW